LRPQEAQKKITGHRAEKIHEQQRRLERFREQRPGGL
jgi:hypothetical protein